MYGKGRNPAKACRPSGPAGKRRFAPALREPAPPRGVSFRPPGETLKGAVRPLSVRRIIRGFNCFEKIFKEGPKEFVWQTHWNFAISMRVRSRGRRAGLIRKGPHRFTEASLHIYSGASSMKKERSRLTFGGGHALRDPMHVRVSDSLYASISERRNPFRNIETPSCVPVCGRLRPHKRTHTDFDVPAPGTPPYRARASFRGFKDQYIFLH